MKPRMLSLCVKNRGKIESKTGKQQNPWRWAVSLTPHCYMLSVSVRHQRMVLTVRKFISYESTRFCRMTPAGSVKFLWEGLQGSKLPKKYCGLDVYMTWIYACIAITDRNSLTPYKEARFSSFSKSLWELADWLPSYSCTDVWWNRPKRIGFPYSIFGENLRCCPCSPQVHQTAKGNKTDR